MVHKENALVVAWANYIELHVDVLLDGLALQGYFAPSYWGVSRLVQAGLAPLGALVAVPLAGLARQEPELVAMASNLLVSGSVRSDALSYL